MRDIEIPYVAFEAAEDAVIAVRDAAPRRPDDADSAAVARAALHAAAPLILAAELERWADAWSVLRDEWRDIDGRTVRSSALGHAVQELNARVAELRTSAAVTPEPAGPRLREWTGSEGGHIYEVQPGWAIWAVSREKAEAEHARYNLGVQCSYGIKVEDLAYHGATEVPAVPPAEPGAGA